MTNSVPEEVFSLGERRAGNRRGVAMEPSRGEFVDALFRRHYAALLRLGVVMLGSREAAEDAVQDAFMALQRQNRSLRDPVAAEAYLRSAVLNRCRSWVRRQVTQRAAPPRMPPPQRHESPEETAVARDEVGALVAVMRTLARRQREVL